MKYGMGAMTFRIVHNQQTHRYRVEKRGFFGWNFVTDPITGDYLSFTDTDAARAWICQQIRRGSDQNRRWKVVTECDV